MGVRHFRQASKPGDWAEVLQIRMDPSSFERPFGDHFTIRCAFSVGRGPDCDTECTLDPPAATIALGLIDHSEQAKRFCLGTVGVLLHIGETDLRWGFLRLQNYGVFHRCLASAL